MSVQDRNGPTAVGVAQVVDHRRLAAGRQRRHLKAFMCSLWGCSLHWTSLGQCQGQKRSAGSCMCVQGGCTKVSRMCIRGHQEYRPEGCLRSTCMWGVNQHTLGTGVAASEM